ncbi:MAG: SDR family NAD(P)-dependent oxidoreductase [Candidatus Marinimicrobia bacterium]|jgi:NAD(P)-dependent dehydrogenase (short-subunit alcohol dehydrogenase family)|nr:beta-ketoacyl-ACP reductase [Parcubacteria group bacterium]MDP7609812.1 SDR family NAD(P)-dependent oxidoreductase [Candidatus Neomarinimicrobiota bacterium]|tara:strand:+ start:4763 stop:5500 length:738 start_codon:yes stop_codon:yes gene_type:complete
MKFKNKTIIVTGGARGIGASIVQYFLDEAAVVYVIDKKNPTEFNMINNENLFLVTGDVTNNNDVELFISDVMSESSSVDVLVNNAGILRDNVIWKLEEEDFDAVINVNLKGPWLMCRAVTSIMRKQNSGRIVNISSRSWLGNFGQSNYSASKGGLVSLTRTLALELARNNITVNAIAPGLIDTPMTRNLDPEIFKKLENTIPMKKAGHPEDIANLVGFLASDEAKFINGQVIHVDGGKSVGASIH